MVAAGASVPAVAVVLLEGMSVRYVVCGDLLMRFLPRPGFSTCVRGSFCNSSWSSAGSACPQPISNSSWFNCSSPVASTTPWGTQELETSKSHVWSSTL